MRQWTEEKQANKCRNLGEQVSNSTLLIPEVHEKVFYERLKNHDGSVSSYLSYLLNKYRFLVRTGIIPKHDYLKTGYQKKELNLKRVDFVPLAEDWAELKYLKFFLNRSMTWIFVALLLLDLLDLDKHLPKDLASFIVPKISHFRVVVKGIFSRKQLLYERILQMTRDRTAKKLEKKN
jgi:hypothetical protein